MTTMNISLPDSMKEYVDAQLESRGYSTSSEYVRDLIRQDSVREAEKQLAAMLQEAIDSGPSMPLDENFWAERRAELKRRFPQS